MEGKGKKVDRDLGACNCDRSDKLILKGVLLLGAPVTAAWTVQSADFDKARPHQEFRTAWSCVESRKCVPNRLHYYCSSAAPLSRNLKLLGLSGKAPNYDLSGRGLQFAAITRRNWHGSWMGGREKVVAVGVEGASMPDSYVSRQLLGCRELTCLWLVELMAILSDLVYSGVARPVRDVCAGPPSLSGIIGAAP